MFRFQYCVTTKASCKLAWEVFSNWRRWNEFANIYGEVAWREGRPWEAGSRLDIEVLEPVKTVVSHLITNCSPRTKWDGSTTRWGWYWRSGSASRSTREKARA